MSNSLCAVSVQAVNDAVVKALDLQDESNKQDIGLQQQIRSVMSMQGIQLKQDPTNKDVYRCSANEERYRTSDEVLKSIVDVVRVQPYAQRLQQIDQLDRTNNQLLLEKAALEAKVTDKEKETTALTARNTQLEASVKEFEETTPSLDLDTGGITHVSFGYGPQTLYSAPNSNGAETSFEQISLKAGAGVALSYGDLVFNFLGNLMWQHAIAHDDPASSDFDSIHGVVDVQMLYNAGRVWESELLAGVEISGGVGGAFIDGINVGRTGYTFDPEGATLMILWRTSALLMFTFDMDNKLATRDMRHGVAFTLGGEGQHFPNESVTASFNWTVGLRWAFFFN